MKRVFNRLEQVPILTAAALFFSVGILTASFVNVPFFVWLFFCIAVIAATFLLRNKDILFSFLFLLLCFGLGALHIRNYLVLPARHISLLNDERLPSFQIRGVIENDPAFGVRKVSFTLKVKNIIIEGKSCAAEGMVLVNAFRQEVFACGDELLLEGRLFKPFSFGERNFSFQDSFRNQGISSVLNVTKEDKISFLGRGKSNVLKGLALRAKHAFKRIFETYLWPENSRVLAGIILGDRQNFPPNIRQAFIQTGTSHIIAISGFNVGIVAFIVLILLKALGMKRKVRYGVMLPLLLIHMYAVGASASVVRATIMAIIVLLAYLVDREPHIINSLNLAALVILGYNPLQIFDIGFQLSFASVLGIVLLTPKIEDFFGKTFFKSSENAKPLGRKKLFIAKWVTNGFAVSLSAWMVTFGLIIYYFRIISPIAVIANLIIVPYTSLIIMLGFSLGLSALVLPVLAPAIATTTNYCLGILFQITHWLSSMPFAYFYLPN